MLFTACEPIGAPEKTEAPAEITTVTTAVPVVEVYGELFEEVPESVVSLSPAIVEIIYELGAEGSLVGVGQNCDYPASAMEENPVCGSPANPDFTAITALAPKLLITQSPIATKDKAALAAAGVRILNIPAVKTVTELETLYDSLAALFEVPTVTLPEILTNPALSSFNMGDFVYYLSDDCTAAGSDTFAGNFLSGYGVNLCPGDSELLLPTAEGDGSDGDSENADGDGSDGDGSDGDVSESDGSDGDAETAAEDIASGVMATAETIILPDYLSFTADEFRVEPETDVDGNTLHESPQVIILSDEATKLLERPTSRVELVLEELISGGTGEGTQTTA
jgi:hypothetical protein